MVLPLGIMSQQGHVEVPVKLPAGFPPMTIYTQGLNHAHLTNVEALPVR